MIEPEAEIAAAISDSGRVGVLATPATVEGGAYRRALGATAIASSTVIEVAAPDLAPIIQRGFPFTEEVIDTCAPTACRCRRPSVDTVILGCTHYPLVAPMLQRILGRDVRLVTAGPRRGRDRAARCSSRAGSRRERHGEGDYRFLCTGDVDVVPRARHALPADAARRGRARRRRRDAAAYPCKQPMSILEQVQADTRDAMKAGERDRVGALRMLANALQQDAKLGDGDEVAVLQRERKRRLEAAEAYREGGSDERPRPRRRRRALIETYLPEQLSDEELAELVDAAVEETGADGPKEMGKVMSAVMPKVEGRADGKRVSAAVACAERIAWLAGS